MGYDGFFSCARMKSAASFGIWSSLRLGSIDKCTMAASVKGTGEQMISRLGRCTTRSERDEMKWGFERRPVCISNFLSRVHVCFKATSIAGRPLTDENSSRFVVRYRVRSAWLNLGGFQTRMQRLGNTGVFDLQILRARNTVVSTPATREPQVGRWLHDFTKGAYRCSLFQSAAKIARLRTWNLMGQSNAHLL